MKHVIAYTDGSSLGNPGTGGIGVYLAYGIVTKEFSFGFIKVTNNQMELLAAVYALFALKETCKITIFSDSAYVVNGIEKGWVAGWKKNGWKNAAKKDVKNPKLWMLLDRLCKRHEVKFKHVKGHVGIEGNEIADGLATGGARTKRRHDLDKFVADLEKEI